MPRLLTILFLFGAPLLLPAALPTPIIVNTTISPAPDGQRFLFLVDMSSAMERLQPEVEATVYELIRSGLGGYMRAGDTYGIWTFNRQAYPGRFSMQVWDPKKVSPLATIAAAFLSEQTYERSSNLKQAIESLGPVIRAVSNLNVLIVSDGGSPMRGTPFDEAINAEYRKKNRERKDLKRPFVTALIIRDGWFVNNSVRISGQPIPLPDRPLPEIVVTKTNLPPVAQAPVAKGKVLDHTAVLDARPNPKAQQTSSVTGLVTAASSKEQVVIKTTQPAVAAGSPADPVAIHSAASSPANLVESARPKVLQITTMPGTISTNAPAATQLVAAAATSEPVASVGTGASNAIASASATIALPPTTEPNPAAQRAASPAVPAHSQPPPASSALDSLSPSPIPVAARELNSEPDPAPTASPAMQAVTTPVQSRLAGGLMLAFGAVLLAAASFLLLVTARRFRPAPQGSLITQSMDTQTMQRR